MSIFAAPHENSVELEKSTMKIISAVTGYKYSANEIIEKVNIVMTDSTFQGIHDNLGHAKIKYCFLFNIDFKNQPFILKALKCLS